VDRPSGVTGFQTIRKTHRDSSEFCSTPRAALGRSRNNVNELVGVTMATWKRGEISVSSQLYGTDNLIVKIQLRKLEQQLSVHSTVKF